MQYSDIAGIVADTLLRSDLASLVPSFIERAESEINRFLASSPVRPMAKVATATDTGSGIPVPSDFIDAINLVATDSDGDYQLVRLGLSDLHASDFYSTRAIAYGDDPALTSRIRHYWIAGDTIYTSATPSSLPLRLTYYGKVPALTSDASTNWVSLAHGDVYEFGVLAYANKKIRDDAAYSDNRDMFLAALQAVVDSYPEKANDTGLRVTDAPWSAAQWSIVSG